MSLYRGVLGRISGGNVTGDTVKREFVEIGDAHLRNVVLDNYHDELLLTATGQEVTLSVAKVFGGGSGVVAIRMPDGRVVKDGFISTIVGNVMGAIYFLFLAIVGGGFFIIIAAGINDWSGPLYGFWQWKNPFSWFGWGLFITFATVALVTPFRRIRAWFAL